MRLFVTRVTSPINLKRQGGITQGEAPMFNHFTQGSTQVYSPFGSYAVEQHDAGYQTRYIGDLPRPDLKLGKDHPLFQSAYDERRAA